MITRRQFLKYSAIAGAAATLPLGFGVRPARAAFLGSPSLQKFAQQLRGIETIPVAASDGTRMWGSTEAKHYTISITQIQDTLHPSFAQSTTLWGFHPENVLVPGTATPRHLGGIIVTKKGMPAQITFKNNLPSAHILPVDNTATPGKTLAHNRAAVHLHGGLVPWISDGGPFDWWTPAGVRGDSFMHHVLNPSLAPNEAEYYYPNNQSARMLWYHDHAWGITRLNAYAGIATAYIIRDDFEKGLVTNNGLPDYIENGGFELPIVIQDKVFVGSDIGTTDPGWTALPVPQTAGSLWYPHVYDSSIFKLKLGGNPPAVSLVTEFWGDTMLANGTVYPEATVEARPYRLRLLNACNARYLNLQLLVEQGPDSVAYGINNDPLNAAGPDFLLLGTEGGFLPRPVLLPGKRAFDPVAVNGALLLGPAERGDVVVDFSNFAGQSLILYNDAPAPFPGGDPLFDFISGPANGFGPTTRQIMRFNVVQAQGTVAPVTISTSTDLTAGNDPLFFDPYAPGQTAYPVFNQPVTRTRNLTLNEAFDEYGRLMPLLGTTTPLRRGTYGRKLDDPATETPTEGDVEVWNIFNLTGDTHPIHFHLVNVQVIRRQSFKLYLGRFVLTGTARRPEPYEYGWKETVNMHPGECITLIMRFDLPQVPFTVPPSPRTGGNEYVWHCHILEHEEHDMMRPLVVASKPTTP
ncbi:MAG: multicopper oxidase domain-containing protein [Nitrospirota bacterium]